MEDLSEEIAEANRAIARAIEHYVTLSAKREERGDDPYVVAWAVYTEYITKAEIHNSASVGLPIYPPDQLPSTSRGLFNFGSDRFQTAKLNPAD